MVWLCLHDSFIDLIFLYVLTWPFQKNVVFDSFIIFENPTVVFLGPLLNCYHSNRFLTY